MELLYIALLGLIIYLIVEQKRYFRQIAERQDEQLKGLYNIIRKLSEQKTAENIPPAVLKGEDAPPPKPAAIPPTPLTVPPPVVVERQPGVITPVQPHLEKPPTPTQLPRKPRPVYEKIEPRPTFFERYPDMEKFIGENFVNKIGIAILVLAIGFFVKYAIDNNWVGPVGRVAIGVLCGGILIGIAHRLRTSYKAFSSVLVGGGLAILYFTITLAYHQFHLFDQLTSFIILIVITCFAVALSLLYNREELAVIALVGGLGSPFMVSSGQANYTGLFLYLVILNAGLLVIAYYKTWRILNASAFGLTVIVFAAILSTLTAPTYLTGFIYGSVLYLMFFAINVANNIRENKKFLASEFSILLLNTALYFSAGMYLLYQMHQQQFKGVFAIALAVVNLVLSFIMFRNRKADTNVLYLLIGITLTFTSLAAPLQLNGHYITLFWAAESVLLYWLFLRSGLQLMKLASILIWAAMLASLLMDWGNVYGGYEQLSVIVNKGFITTICCAVSSYLLSRLITQSEDKLLSGITLSVNLTKYTGLGLLFLSGVLEINYQFSVRYSGTQLNILYIGLYLTAFVYIFYQVARRINSADMKWRVYMAFIAIAIAVYIIITILLFDIQENLLKIYAYDSGLFAANWAAAIIVALLFYELTQIARRYYADEAMASWILATGIVLFLSLQISLACNMIFYTTGTTLQRIETVYIKVGLPILWGLSSFVLMILGMRYKARTLRIISLSLFTITLVKLFAFDIQGIPPAGKIAAFFCLGILLLIVSFMYQKVKKILVDDEANKSE